DVRLAFLSPLPPAPTGIADYSADVLALLAGRHEIDAFHAEPAVEGLPSKVTPRPVAELLPRHRERPYDVAVYQMGNGPEHSFLYDLMQRVPGLLVLHDLVLHHARARQFLDSPEARAYAGDPSNAARRDAARPAIQAYRDEAAYCYPAQAGRLAEAHLGTVGDLLPYAYPLFRIPVEASRLVAVHNEYMAEAIRDEVPSAAVMRIPMAAERVPVAEAAVTALRVRLGLDPDDFVVGCFGLLTREKQIETVARAVARAASALPQVRLLLVGPTPHRERLEALLARLGLREWTTIAGRVPLVELPAHIEAADMVAHLRYPTARETSAALLRVLAQGRPTVISDLEHLDIPPEAVVRLDVTAEEGGLTRAIVGLAGDAQG
ncbi:MAG: glycosyltransferase, partial [Candidatus Rokubacteria bacterium]|nr:glycosyltransferase [Candidatus Rokubacteria bacterium]